MVTGAVMKAPTDHSTLSSGADQVAVGRGNMPPVDTDRSRRSALLCLSKSTSRALFTWKLGQTDVGKFCDCFMSHNNQ